MIEPVARLRIELQEIEPKVFRRVDVPLTSTLLTLHEIIQWLWICESPATHSRSSAGAASARAAAAHSTQNRTRRGAAAACKDMAAILPPPSVRSRTA